MAFHGNPDYSESEYLITFDGNGPSYWMDLKGVVRIFSDGGSLICYDEDDAVVYAFAPGFWKQVMHRSVFEASING